MCRCDQLDRESRRILEAEDFLPEAGCTVPGGYDAPLTELGPPRRKGVGRNRKGSRGDLAGALSAGGYTLPFVREGGEQGSRLTGPVSIVEVIDVVVVEVDGFLYQPESQRGGVEIDVRLGVIDGGGDVVESLNGGMHRVLPESPMGNIARSAPGRRGT